MSIQTVTITGVTNPVEVYGGSTACSDYIGARSTPGAVAFRALTGDDPKRKLVEASVYIDQRFWQGAATGLAGGTPTVLQWPRSGLTDVNGNALDPTNVPQLVLNAVFEMVMILCVDPDAASDVDAGNNIRELGAGSDRLVFFNPTANRLGSATVLPEVLDRLLGRWLATAAGAAALTGLATGTSSRSDFVDECSVCNTTPCCCGTVQRDIVWPI